MNVIRIKYAMRRYAREHELVVPRGYTPSSPVWGKGARTLAWRVTGHLRSHGKAIAQSARLTADLAAALLPESFGARVVRLARREIGVTEQPAGSNDGPRVRQYQATTGAYHQPWCASFVAWVYRMAGYDGPLPSTPAWVPAWAYAAKAGKPLAFSLVAKIAVRRGDFVTLWGNGHIEIFDHWIIPGVLAACIGGNTSPIGKNANGGMVAATRRYVTEFTAVGRVRG